MEWKRIFSGKPSTPAAAPEDPAQHARRVVAAYHETTKHAPGRFARGPGELDWDTQPDSFRRWAGTELLPLAHAPIGELPRYEEVFVEGLLAPRPLDRAFVSQLFEDSLALSAWKRLGAAHWSLRVNPSSGNLHPTEGYLVAPAVPELSDTPFVAHYAPKEHALEVRARFDAELWARLARGLPPGVASGPTSGAVLVGLASIHWRESWKYGERAYRYCNHDAGHAIACVTLAAAAMGWRATLLDGLGTDEIRELLHLGDTTPPEAEEPDCILAIHPAHTACAEPRLDATAMAELARATWRGTPNALSPDHVDWEVIELAAQAARKPPNAPTHEGHPVASPGDRPSPEPNTPGPPLAIAEPRAPQPVLARTESGSPWPPLAVGDEPIPFRRIVHQRRSAVAMDGRSGLARDAFYQTLRRTLPGRGEHPFTALSWTPRIHLALFVHRVADLEPGLYFLARNPADEPALRAALRPEFLWTRPPECPAELPLAFLRAADVRGLAAHVSCDQQIAADGCFSLGMLARFTSSLEEDGAWMYPRLFWEAGVVGQALYLEAEALGIRSTGIGCFYDDAVHAVLGLRDRAWQSLYHFTIGGAVDDPRITKEPAYAEPRE